MFLYLASVKLLFFNLSSNILISLYAFSISSSLERIAKPISGTYFSFYSNSFEFLFILLRVFSIFS